MLPGNRIKVTGIALWNTKNEKYGPNIGELDFEADLKNDTVSWTDTDGYRITIASPQSARRHRARCGRPLRDECDLRGALHENDGLTQFLHFCRLFVMPWTKKRRFRPSFRNRLAIFWKGTFAPRREEGHLIEQALRIIFRRSRTAGRHHHPSEDRRDETSGAAILKQMRTGKATKALRDLMRDGD